MTWENKLILMTWKQKLVLGVLLLLPAGSLILIFSPLGRRTIRKLVKTKTMKTSGKCQWCNNFEVELTDEDIYKDLTHNID